MSFIPVVYNPYPDELLYSWICHLAEDNGLSFVSFLQKYMKIECKGPSIPIYTDVHCEFSPLYQSVYTNELGNMKDLYLRLSTFQFETMVMPPWQQVRYVNNIFRRRGPLNTTFTKSLIKNIKICPECFREDTEKYGRPYFHRSHQLSGVCTCHKHGTRLLQYDGKPKYEFLFNPDDYREIETEVSTKSQKAYTDYAQALFEAQLETNAIHLREVLYDRLNTLGYEVSNYYKPFANDFKTWEYSDLSDVSDLNRYLRKKLINANCVNIEEVMPILMFLFPNVTELIKELQDDEPVLEMYSCPNCGMEYCSTPKAQSDGWGCPNCEGSLPVQDMFVHLVDTIGHGEYQVLDDFQSLGHSVRMYHNKCGTVSEIKPRSFLFSNQKCTCESVMTFEVAKAQVESNEGFKLIEFKRRASTAQIYHENCGQTFSCWFPGFLKNPACRICNPPVINTDSLKKRMYDLVGDEYTLLGEYENGEKKVKIRHNVCGCVQEYKAYYFLNGQRCSKCTDYFSHKDVEQILKEYSNGKYDILDYKNKMYTIQNKETKERIYLNPYQILQEIRRPTPSPILPVDKESKGICDLVSTWERQYQLLLEYKDEFGTVSPPTDEVYHGCSLGSWCRTQQRHYKDNTLKPERLSKLNSIGFVWDKLETAWDRKYDLCKAYLSETGKEKITFYTVYKGEKIGNWISEQRNRYREGKLPDERKQKLLKLYPNIFAYRGK